jgi:peptidoglycan/xylan/chitin deacetylase (PgdA/CDA1 family)
MNTDKSAKPILAVLSYHKIGSPRKGQCSTWNYVAEEIFADHLRILKERGWQVIDQRTFLRALLEPDSLPHRSALLTFDDGYRSMLTQALPILCKFRYPAVVFVPTDYVGRCNSFDEGIEPEERICSWDELLELERHDISIQSHGSTHRHFSLLDVSQQQKELWLSRRQIQEKIEKQVMLFAYPYGDCGTNFGDTEKALVQAGYKAAFLYGGGVQAFPVKDPFRMHRLAMGPDSDLEKLLQCADNINEPQQDDRGKKV